MKSLETILPRAVGHMRTQQHASSERLERHQNDDLVKRQKKEMFDLAESELVAMLSLYCVDFVPKFGDSISEVMREYCRCLWSAGLKLEDLQRGIRNLSKRDSKWTPTPVEFRDLCQPSPTELGLPEIEDVYNEIIKAQDWYRRHPVRQYSWSCRFAELVGSEIFRYFSLANEKQRLERLSSSYYKWLDHARHHPLPEKRLAIAEMPEPRPVIEEYMRNTGYIPCDPELQKRIERCRRLRQQALSNAS